MLAAFCMGQGLTKNILNSASSGVMNYCWLVALETSDCIRLKRGGE